MPLVLKRGRLGTITRERRGGVDVVVRDTRPAHPAVRWLARRLAAREAAALETLAGIPGVPTLRAFDGAVLERTFLDGTPMHASRPASPRYFARGLGLLRQLHRRGIAHNDLAKEANWICTPDGLPGVVDFQIALISRRRGPLFRALAREDLRHLLKHKRTYLPDRLTARQRKLLARPGALSAAWARLVKPPYRLVTRGLLGWPERTGPEERRAP